MRGWVVFSFEERYWHRERTNSGLGGLKGSEMGDGVGKQAISLIRRSTLASY